MIQPAGRRTGTIQYLPSRSAVSSALVTAVATWLLVTGGSVGTALFLPRLDWSWLASLVVLGGSPWPAVWATRRFCALRRIRRQVPPSLLDQRRYGDLALVVTNDGRPLRPVGMSAAEVADRTDTLLNELITIPSVRIFRGVRPAGAARPVVTHAVSAGPVLILVESVAWPPGRYRTEAGGRVYCDGQYIGQSTHALSAAVPACRALLPRRHEVSALIVVHRTAHGSYTLPAAGKELTWTLAEDLPDGLRPRLARHPWTVSRHTVAAFAAPLPPGQPGDRRPGRAAGTRREPGGTRPPGSPYRVLGRLRTFIVNQD